MGHYPVKSEAFKICSFFHCMTLTGTIPFSTYDLETLKIFYLTMNSLSGTFSRNITKLQRLSILNLKNNNLNKQVLSFSGSSKLQFIQLDSNQFSGPLPSFCEEISFRQKNNTIFHYHILVSISSVNVSKFRGTDFTIERVDISFNLMSGTIPAYVALIPSFRYVALSGNSFSRLGTIPGSWRSLQFFGATGSDFPGLVKQPFNGKNTSQVLQ